MTRVGVMGGTFDPIHHGHLVTAEEARVQFDLDGVIFIPSGQPPHKDPADVTPSEHRYLMTFLATVSNPHITVSRLEIDRSGPSYTIDTLRLLAEEIAGAELFYITGADAIMQIMRGEWERSPDLLGLCEFIAATRPGFVLDLDVLKRHNCTGRPLVNVHVMAIPALAISSTEIRARVRTGRPIKYLVPEAVEAYIVKHGLYREDSARRGPSGG
ncbi:MAG: nicotinate-nucleotide adenylyltransferase [bacterium]|nr:nicotinate-nucleotide adenylyltransferase [bacterium]